MKLFERGARGMNLTDAGHLLYRYAIANRAELDGLRSQAEEFDALRRGQVRIASVEGMLTSFLPDFFIGLSRDYPGISMSVPPWDREMSRRWSAKTDIGLMERLVPSSGRSPTGSTTSYSSIRNTAGAHAAGRRAFPDRSAAMAVVAMPKHHSGR